MEPFFEFEKPIATLEKKLQDLRDLSRQEGVNLKDEILALERKLANLIDDTYSKLNTWQRVQLSRHPNRPYTRDYVDALFPQFMELQGDRTFSDDQAILAGVALWPPAQPGAAATEEPKAATAKPSKGSKAKKKAPPTEAPIPVLILGHQKGRSTKERMERNFGMAKPEGYRKAMRLMQLAERQRWPIITFIDTPGAYPGIEAEERGQSQAIAESIRMMFGLTVPIVSLVIGEGGSGGALAIGVANKVLMQEYSTYSVISPESCASILWSDSRLAERASEKLKMNPPDLLRFGVIDDIVSEPKGGAHRDWNQTFSLVRSALIEAMEPMLKGDWAPLTITHAAKAKNGKEKQQIAFNPVHVSSAAFKIRDQRIQKFRAIGQDAIVRAMEMSD